MRIYKEDAEVLKVVKGFETCTTDKTRFKHREHLTVAVVYLQGGDIPIAVNRMRLALLAFLDHHGVSREKYSEEVTFFWLRQVSDRLSELEVDLSLAEKCNHVIEALKDVRSE